MRFFRAALRGVRAELAAGQSGWVALADAQGWPEGGTRANSGKTVSAESSMTVSAVWSCVRRTAELIATLPLAQYQKEADGGRVRLEDDVSDMLVHRPNRRQTAVEFWEGMVAHQVLRGNGCAERLMIGPRTVGLDPLPNARPRLRPDRALEYEYVDRGKRVVLPADKVFHLRGFGVGDGIGLSAIKYGANSIGAALAADETAGRVFANGAMPSGVLYSDQTLNATQRAQLRSMLEAYTGSDRAGRIMALEAGLKYQQLQMNPEDAQLLETRRFAVEDICRWFGMPPVVIGHSADGQTMWGSGIEQILLSWLTLGINPLLTRIEKRIGTDLIAPAARRRRYFEFTREAMLQMDSKAKGDFMLKMRMGGFMSGDEGRDKLNLPRRGGQSDALFVQTSMEPVDLIGKDRQ